MKEIWKDIIGCEGKYQISSTGRVKSLTRMVGVRGNAVRTVRSRFLKQTVLKKGYCVVTLKVSPSKSINHLVHRLVAIHFINNDDRKPQINHINGIKSDNRASNLEWVTNQENRNHAVENRLHVYGERVGVSKLLSKQVRIIRSCKGKVKAIDLADIFNVSKSTIDNILQKRSWKHI